MKEFPLAWLFFVPFILITTFAVLNLFIGIIVDAMQQIAKDGNTEDKLTERELHKKIINIEKQLRDINKTLENKK